MFQSSVFLNFNSLFPIPFRGDSFAPGSVSTVDSNGNNMSTSGIVPVLSSAKLLSSESLELVPKNGVLY